MTSVLNARLVGKLAHPDRVYIGRPSKWGNPFVIGRHGNRWDVIAKYGEFLMGNPALLASIGELWEKDLVCWCHPELCHGDILVELARDKAFIIQYAGSTTLPWISQMH
jgi:hypothetical protein